jgi:hypothetical protein
MPSVVLGRDTQTGEQVEIGDIERRSGFYILGKPGMGKSALMVNMARQDIEHKHSVFFLDPHGDAISDLLKKFNRPQKVPLILLDPQDREYSFGIDLLSCYDTSDLAEVTYTYTRAYNVFYKLWEDSWGPWLQLILQNTLWAFIENQEYTLAEIPMFLNSRNTEFRNHIINNIKLNPACVDFWKYEFFQRRERDQQERVDAALTRINTLLTHPYIRHIVGQKDPESCIGVFILQFPFIILFNLSANLSEDIKKFIGTIIISELLHIVRNRPGEIRTQLSVFIDEFQNFTAIDDFRTLITEGRKFGVATTFAHQERFGQFADNQKLMGATLAAVNKVFFQLTVPDAKELAPEFAKEATTTETRLEPELVITQEPFWDLMRRGHANPQILACFNKHIRKVHDQLDYDRMELEAAGMERLVLQEEASLLRDQVQLSSVGERRERLGLYSGDRSSAMQSNYSALASSSAAIEQLIQSHKLSEDQAIKVKALFGRFREFRMMIRNIDRFLTGIMQNHSLLIAEQELYAQFFIAIFNYGYVTMGHIPVFWLYLQLEFGDPIVPRSIPAIIAMKYFSQQLEDAYLQEQRESYVQYYRKVDPTMEIRSNSFEASLKEDLRHYRNTEITLKLGNPAIRKKGYKSHEFLPNLPLRTLTGDEIKTIKVFCYDELLEGIKIGRNNPVIFQIVEELKEFCQLLSRPENHIKVASGQYVEKQVHVRPVHDMTDEMAQELINLPRYTAYAKVIEEKDGKQNVWSGKIETFGLPKDSPKAEENIAFAIEIGHGVSKKRGEIEEEIRQRQEKWRQPPPQTPEKPPEEPPPPPTTF